MLAQISSPACSGCQPVPLVPSVPADPVQTPSRAVFSANVSFGDFANLDGHLYQTVYKPRRGALRLELGPALFVWPSDSGFWLECARGGFGLPSIHEMRADAWTGAVSVLNRKYKPEWDRAMRVVDYLWQAWFHRVAVTPAGVVSADGSEAFAVLDACARGRGAAA